MNDPALDQKIQAITRPDRSLLTYYLLASAAFPPAFPFLVLPLYFRYHTLHYRFTEDGISMRWGILFRREVIVNYARIQDIHLRSNVVERWLGLARILIQTASGSRSAEMTIEGVREFEALRDFLYAKTRGVKDHPPAASEPPATLAGSAGGGGGELVSTLREVAQELREVRRLLEERGAAGGGRSRDV